MSNLYFILRSIVYLLMFLVTWFAMDAINYEKLLRKNKVNQAQVLYFILVMAIAYLAGSFILSFSILDKVNRQSQ
ncbi:DUF1146 domain-containing protein [uncultured Solobacterium sp.]|uniref:DUF1146 domain-containing protein n=1 Tax=uncultured Solobacterium sp. TaxID=747375 RepID=UPI0028DB2867|nr:DUF1146 domain-containing protein [uncultured Solobacterium sp.]